MAEPVDYPTPELLEKIAEVATIFKDFRRTATPCDMNSTTINIKDMMNPETFELPMDWDQPGSQLYRRIISVFGLTPTIVRKLHLERHFSEEDVDKHIDHFNGRFGTTVRRTRKDMPLDAKFTEEQINSFMTNALFMGAHQLRINRQAILDKWKRKDIVYPTSPEDFGNEKYRQVVLYHGFTADLRKKLKQYLGSNKKIDAHIVYLRKHFSIGSQKKGAKISRHVTPESFPELAYWPRQTLLPPEEQSTPSPPDPPRVSSSAVGKAPLPRSKEYLRTQRSDEDSEKLPDLTLNVAADSEELREQVQSLQIGEVQGFLTGLFGEDRMNLREEMDLGDPNEQLLSSSVETGNPTPPPSRGSRTPSPPQDPSDSTSAPPKVPTPPPINKESRQTARKSTGGKVPRRVSTTLITRKVTPARPLPPTPTEEFLKVYIPDLMDKLGIAVGCSNKGEETKLRGLLKTAQAALNELVQRRSPPIIEIEHTKQEDLKVRLKVINDMVVTRTLLEAFEPWFTLREDVLECRKHMGTLDYLIPKFRDFSVSITKEELATAQASMHFMDRVSKTVTPLRKPEGYPSFSDEDESENIEVTVKNARAPPTPPTLDSLTEYIPDILRRMYHFRRSGEKTRLDKHKIYLGQALSELQEILKCDSAGEPDQTKEKARRNCWIQHIREMINILTCMVPWLAEPENKTLAMNYSQRLKTLLPGFEGENYPTRGNLEEVKDITKWYREFLATPTEMIVPPGVRTFSEEEDPVHEEAGDSPQNPQESEDEVLSETPRPVSEREDSADPEDNGIEPKPGKRKSRNRIDSDSDDSTKKDSGKKKDAKVTREFQMTLRGQKNFEELSLGTENPRKRSREDMESTSNQLERPTQTPQGEKILYARPWIPVYFKKSGTRQTPSYPVEFTKKCDGKTKKFRSEGVEGQFNRRVTRKPQRFDKSKPDMEPWEVVAKAMLNFRLPAKTATNVTWTVPKDGQGKGQCRFKPSTLALSEMKHFMGVANVDRPHATSGPGEYGLILPKAAMRRVIMELGMKRKEDIRFESTAYHIIHYAAEHYLTRIYQDAVMLASHMKRCTVTDKDMLLARRLTGDYKAHDIWAYQRSDQIGIDIVRSEATADPQKSRWSYQHQEWKKKGK